MGKSLFTWRLAVVALLVLVASSVAAQESAEVELERLGIEELMAIRVTTASKQEEPLRETPVPVTVITADMIEHSGARNLKELLVTFVPGMTFNQDHNEVNVAMRGVYASSQQKFLVLVEGHRLNNRSYSEANPDFSISLDKIAQIEVLRGPGSSLYGNVALTAVVNIVLKRGKDLNGGDLSLGIGSHGQRTASLLWGRRFDRDSELLLWGSSYRSDGEQVNVPAAEDYVSADPQGGTAIVDGFRDQPSHDLGFKLRSGRFSLFASSRYCKYIEPFSGGGVTGQVYRYDDYRKYHGTGPGLASDFKHLGLTYTRPLGQRNELQLNAYFDRSEIAAVLIINPAAQVFAAPGWLDQDYGMMTQVRHDFTWTGIGKGSLVAGLHIDRMELLDSWFPLGSGGEWTGHADTSDHLLLARGQESIYSVYAQLKQRVGDRLLVNIGFRYDNKDRHSGENVSDFNPRMALIYLPSKTMEWKLSYASSFVDAPYWYRHNSLASYRGGADLKPEHLESLQLTASLTSRDRRLNATGNLFYNRLTDFVFRDTSVPLDAVELPIYRNAGLLESWGFEAELSYLRRDLQLRGNVTYQEAIKAEDYGETDGDIHNVPGFTANLIADYALSRTDGSETWLNLTLRYVGEQLSPIVIDAFGVNMPDHEVDQVVLVNAGARCTGLLGSGLWLDARIYNAFDQEYRQGGAVLHPYPQPGRWYLLRVGYRFD